MPDIIFTTIGYAKTQEAIKSNKALELAKFIFADNNAEINEDVVKLENVVYENYITHKEIISEKEIKIQTVIPTWVGGFNINKLGIEDTEGDLICVGTMPNTSVPDIKDNTTKEIDIKLTIYVDSADKIEIVTDPSATLITQDKLNFEVKRLNSDLEEKANKDKVVTSINGETGDVVIESGSTKNQRSVSYVIANYDSNNKSKESADLVIPEGEDATRHIRTAISAIRQNGGDIKLMEGEYDIRSMIDLNHKNITLSGIPNATILKQNPDTWATDRGTSIIELHDNCIVKDLIMVKEPSHKTMGLRLNDNSKVESITVYNAGNHGFFLQSSSEAFNCSSIGAVWIGFYLTENSTATNCMADSKGRDGFLATGESSLFNCKTSNQSQNGIDISREASAVGCETINCNTGYYVNLDATVTGCVALNSRKNSINLTEYFRGVVAYNILRGGTVEDNSKNTGIFESNIIT